MSNRSSCVALVTLFLYVVSGVLQAGDSPVSNPADLVATPLAIHDSNGGPLFRDVPPSDSGVEFQLKLPNPRRYINELMFLNPYGGIATGDYDGDGLADFYVASPEGAGRLYRNLGGMKFRDVTTECGLDIAGMWGTGVTFVDIDNDGDLDLYVCCYLQPNRLFINQGPSSDGIVKFVDRAKEFRLNYDGASMSMAFADIDNDGDLDGYLATTARQPPPGTRFQVRFEDGKPIVLEHLREYWQLIYLPGDRAKRTESGQYDHLYRNDGDRFVEITKAAGIEGPYFTLAATWWDFNADNLPDIYVSNDFLGPDKLYQNLGNGKFRDVIKEVIPHTPWFSMGSDFGDVNNDGLIDFLATDMAATNHYREKVMMGNMDDNAWFLDFAEPRQYMRNALYLNTGVNRMREAAFMSGLASSDWTWNPRLADFDNDGRLDLFLTDGTLRDNMNSDLTDYANRSFKDGSPQWADFWVKQPMHPESNHAFRNTGDTHFERVDAEWGLDRKGISFGAATADFDNDGDLDLVVNNADAPVSVYENQSPGSSVIVRLRGNRSNRFGLGATVRIKTAEGQQVRYVTQTRGYLSSCDPALHFGLGEAETIEELTVSWPSGARQRFEELPAGNLLTITESVEGHSETPESSTPAPLFKATSALSKFAHLESEFDDFAKQPLLPNQLSRGGPALACGDVNGDGHADIYLGGSAGRPGQMLMTGAQPGSYVTTNAKLFAADARHEDIDALLFDADGDQDLDLYVASGSNEWEPSDAAYRDRLYLNDGAGKFTRAGDALPEVVDSSSTVAAGDIDNDGDLDLFVGSHYVPGSYPTPGTSRLLVNVDGKFEERPLPALQKQTLVTDATFSDVNGDGQIDLVIAAEWGPVHILLNQDGAFTDHTSDSGIADLTGWWTSITQLDANQDGAPDFLVGNFGRNTKYKASKKKPELLYYGEFDDSGNAQLVEAKYVDGKCLPRRGFSCSRNAMPFLDKKFQTFHNFASATLEQLYTPELLGEAQLLKANTLESGLLLNRGNGEFDFLPLPTIAQIAPSFGAATADLNGDGIADLVLAQNYFAPQLETGRMDGGLGLVLLAQGDGTFRPLSPKESGMVAPFDSRKVALIDINNDELLDIVVAENNGPLRVFEATGENAAP